MLTYAQLTDFADCLEPLYEEMRHQEQLTLVRSLLGTKVPILTRLRADAALAAQRVPDVC